MNLLADESVDESIVARLRQDSHEVIYVAELEPGIPDSLVLDRANEQGALLLTADKDFGELTFRMNRVHGGGVLVRLAGLSTEAKADLVAAAFISHGAKFAGHSVSFHRARFVSDHPSSDSGHEPHRRP
jgi:predicted nuclease of predicted toxin-antitoxin system